MSLSIIFRPTPSSIDAITLDATVSEEHSGEVDVTEHPVEAGSNVTDHVRKKPDTLRVEGVVVDFPVDLGGDSLDTRLGAEGRSKELLALLEGLRDAGETVEVRSGLKSYDRMIIQSVKVPRDKSDADSVRLSIVFRHVRIVTSQTVALQITKAKTNQGKGKVDAGKQTGAPAEEATKRKSILLSIVDNVSGSFKKDEVR